MYSQEIANLDHNILYVPNTMIKFAILLMEV